MYGAWLKATSFASKTSKGAGGQGGEKAGREVEVVLDYDLRIFEALGKGGKRKGKANGEEGGDEVVVLGNCAACGRGGGIMSVCKDEECGVATHITCLAHHSLRSEDSNGKGGEGGGQILPTTARCPRCKGKMGWSDVAGGVTGRIRRKAGKAGEVGAVGVGVGADGGDASASGSGLESGSESEADSWAGVVEL